MTRRIRCLFAIAVFSMFLTGCVGFGETASERSHRWDAVHDTDMRGLVTDTDLIFQTDRPSRLNKWHGR